jgi:hypothetical protein
MELPTVKMPALRKSPKSLIIYGPPKIGKTTQLSQLEDCLTIDMEEGSDFLEMLKVKVKNLDELRAICNAIVLKNKPYKRVALDTITKLEEWCEKEATKNYMESPMGLNFNKYTREDERKGKGKFQEVCTGSDYKSVLTLPNGAGYLWLREAYKDWIDKAGLLAHEIIFVGHIKDKMIEKAGKEVAARDIDLTGKLKQIACANADAIGYMYREGGQTMITFNSTDEIACGSRCEHLKGQTFEMDWKKIYID